MARHRMVLVRSSLSHPADRYPDSSSQIVFKVPPTHSFIHTLSHTIFTSHLTILTLLSFAFQIYAFIYLPKWARSPFFFIYFAGWRAAYDAGLGWVLRRQSERRWIVRQLRKRGWLERAQREGEGEGEIGNAWAKWWKRELEAKMGHEGYRWDAVPEEFNAWLMFRQVVDVILLKWVLLSSTRNILLTVLLDIAATSSPTHSSRAHNFGSRQMNPSPRSSDAGPSAGR